MYENYKLCETLTPSEICFVVEQYSKGAFIRQFHEHVPKLYFSEDARRNVLRAPVVHFSEMGASAIVRCYMNGRGRRKAPNTRSELDMIVSYPEAGVFRTYCGINTKAWSDQVISAGNFREKVG
jgi:hypothetical protein